MLVPLSNVAYINMIMKKKNSWSNNTDSPPLLVLFPTYTIETLVLALMLGLHIVGACLLGIILWGWLWSHRTGSRLLMFLGQPYILGRIPILLSWVSSTRNHAHWKYFFFVTDMFNFVMVLDRLIDGITFRVCRLICDTKFLILFQMLDFWATKCRILLPHYKIGTIMAYFYVKSRHSSHCQNRFWENIRLSFTFIYSSSMTL